MEIPLIDVEVRNVNSSYLRFLTTEGRRNSIYP